MATSESVVLIRRAIQGDQEALQALFSRYYPRWLKRFHGHVGLGLRSLSDTQDFVQSAIADALRDLGNLRSEGAFFGWVCAIVRRKMAEKRRRGGAIRPAPLDNVEEPEAETSPFDLSLANAEEYIRLLDAILELYPTYPEPMACIYLRYFEKMKISALSEVFSKSERSVHRLLEKAVDLLRGKMGTK